MAYNHCLSGKVAPFPHIEMFPSRAKKQREPKLQKGKKSPRWHWKGYHNYTNHVGLGETQAPHFLLATSQSCCTELWAPPGGSHPTSFISPLYV